MGSSALVVGAGGGIGRAVVAHLLDEPNFDTVTSWARQPSPELPASEFAHVDITAEATIAEAAERLTSVDLVVVATGVLHNADGLEPEKTWQHLDRDRLIDGYMVNAVGPALVAKHVLPRLPRGRRAVFAAISARVGSIEDNRLGGWYGYRAAKAALNQMIKCLSIELARSRPDAVCVALHPGTVDTSLSRPFQRGIPADRLFSPHEAAGNLLRTIDGLAPSDTGRLISWDGSTIPY